ncbi:MAG: hypothetical protein MW690_001038 [Methanophagales archaeon]|nr:hypothetical protein [Methanophagales archaeon]
MPSSRLELRQWLVYAAHDPEDFASEPSSLESLITGNLPAQLSIISNKVFKGYPSSTRLGGLLAVISMKNGVAALKQFFGTQLHHSLHL